MATKPATKNAWATTPGTTSEPSDGQKAAGFAESTRPPAEWFNWLVNWLWQAALYLLDGIFTTATVNGDCITATGNGSGAGVVGKSDVAGSGPGVKAQAQGTGTGLDAEPVGVASGGRAAAHIGPQKSALGSVVQGDVALLQPNVASPGAAKLNVAGDATHVDRYVPQVGAACTGTASPGSPVTLATIPANTLRTGSVIEVDIIGTSTGDGATPPAPGVYLDDGTNQRHVPGAQADTGAGAKLYAAHGIAVIGADPGAGVAVGIGGRVKLDTTDYAFKASTTLNTNAQITVKVMCEVAGSLAITAVSVRVT